MASESVIWTLLPSGVDPETGDLRSTIFVSPRLRTGGGTCHLPEFPVFRHWAQAVVGLTFIAEIDGLGGLELTPDPHRIGAPDPGMWDLLFGDPNITVEEPLVRNLNSRRVFSFPADAVASSVLSLYTEVGAAHPTEHPSVLDPLLAGLAADLGRIGDDTDQRGVYYGLDAWFDADPTRGDRPGRFIPQYLATGSRQRSFMLANRFYDRYEGTERLRDRRGPIDSAAVPPPPDRPSLDFHRYVAALGDYPELLRRLGLAIDVRMQAHPDIAKHQRYRLMVGGDAPDWMNADTASPWMNYLWDGKLFLPRTRPDGRHDVADGQLTLDNGDFYTVHQIDIDGSALKTTHVAGTISRRIALVQSKNGATMAPTTSSLPALRGGGLTIVRRNAAAAVVNQFDHTARLDDNEKTGQRPVLWADDVIRGFRYEAERDGDGRFRSLVDRVGTYRYHQSDGSVVPLDLGRDQGYVKGSSTTSVPDKKNPEPDLYLHEAVASWSGWSMVAPRPGGGVNRQDRVTDEPPLERDANIPLETAFTVTPGSLPRLRYGSSYRLRARTVDLAGNSVDPGTIDDRHASPPAVFKRWEPVPAPAVVPRRRKLDTDGTPVLDKSGHAVPVHTEGESQMRLVIRSTAGMTVADYVALDRVAALVDPVNNPTHIPYLATDDRWIVAPKTSQQMAEWHGMFDEAIGSGDPALIQQAFDIACRSTEELPPVEPAATCSIPYLPDVSSRGVLFNRFPADPAVYRRVEWPTDSGAWWDRQPFRIVLADGPAAAPVTPTGNPVAPVWNPADRTLTVHVPQAEMVTVRLSSAVDQGDLDIQGMYERIVGHRPAEADARRHEAALSRNWMLTPWVELTFVHAVEKPLADPTVAVHNSGMVRNANETFCVLQGAITNHAKSTGRLDVEAVWTEQADDISEDVPADGVNGGAVRTLHSHVGDFLIEAFENSALVGRDDVTTPTGKGNTHRLRHEFGNTRHRVVEYRARATTRFREYFPTQITDAVDQNTNQPLIRRDGPPAALIVPSSRRPDPPDIAYIIPTFRWTEDLVPLPASGGSGKGLKMKFQRRRTRHGGGLRVYLRRPWYSSGDGEQLGVVLQDQPWLTYPVDQHAGMTIADADRIRVEGFLAEAGHRTHVKLDGPQSVPIAERFLRGLGVSDAQLAGNDEIVLRSGKFAGFTNLSGLLSQVDLASLFGGNIETWLTKVGTDPVFASHVVPADGPYIHQLPLRTSVRGGLTPVESPSETVTVVGHTPKFDAARKLWYCDIELDPDRAYQPFVRLALCRYQPHSIDGCHMSRIVRADFAQLLPERVATLTPLGENRAAITLTGPAGMGWLGTTGLVGMDLTRTVTATVQRLDPGKDADLGWADMNSPIDLKYAPGPTVPGDVTWSAMLPGFVRQDGSSYRVLLQEFEFHLADETATAHPFDAVERWSNDELPRKYWVGRRLVYADTFSL